jgi:hypothetical protein
LQDFSWCKNTKRGKINTKLPQRTYTKWRYNTPNGLKSTPMVIKYTQIFHSMAHKNEPKLEFLVRKFTIWQPCFLQFDLKLCVSSATRQ